MIGPPNSYSIFDMFKIDKISHYCLLVFNVNT